MTSRPDNTRHLRAAEQAHHADLTKRALDAIRALVAAGHPVNFSTVARAAGCSRSFLNRHPQLAGEVRRLRATAQPAASQRSAMTDASAKARVEQLRVDNTRLRDDNSRLRAQVAALLEQLRSSTNTRPEATNAHGRPAVTVTHDHPQRAGSRYPHRADACTDRHLRDRAPVLRCYGCAILAWAGAGGPQPRPSQQVRPGDR